MAVLAFAAAGSALAGGLAAGGVIGASFLGMSAAGWGWSIACAGSVFIAPERDELDRDFDIERIEACRS